MKENNDKTEAIKLLSEGKQANPYSIGELLKDVATPRNMRVFVKRLISASHDMDFCLNSRIDSTEIIKTVGELYALTLFFYTGLIKTELNKEIADECKNYKYFEIITTLNLLNTNNNDSTL